MFSQIFGKDYMSPETEPTIINHDKAISSNEKYGLRFKWLRLLVPVHHQQ